MSWPGMGRVRLWEDAMAVRGCNGPDGEQESRGCNKYLVPVGPPEDPFTPRPLRGIYHLGIGQTAAAIVEILMQNIYCSTSAAPSLGTARRAKLQEAELSDPS